MLELQVQRGGNEGLLRVCQQKPREMRAPVNGRWECGRYLNQPPQPLRAPGMLALDHLGVLDTEGQGGGLPCLAARCRSTRDYVYLDVALRTVLCCLCLPFKVLVALNPPARSLRGAPR